MDRYDIVVIGAGAAGIAAAQTAYMAGCESVLLIDRRWGPGGVLLQCLHRGFGQHLTGVEYTHKLLEEFPEGVHTLFDTTVLSVSADRSLLVSGQKVGLKRIEFGQLILAAGCMEIPAGALPIGGTRPEGIYTAGQVQEMINIHHRIPQGPAVILGSGDLGLIMAEQLLLEGVELAALIEQKPRCSGMARNQRCLTKYNIPLYCSSTITEVFGKEHLREVKMVCHISKKETMIPCKSLLIAAGLRPDQSLLYEVGRPDWVHLCGNCRTVHPMVEAVVAEGREAGLSAYRALKYPG